jgi:hypothetical protein
MNKMMLNSFRTIARCEAIYRSRHVEADKCLVDSDHFNTMVTDIFDGLVLKEFKNMQTKVDHASWVTNPDRSGGQFTQDEIDRARGENW